MNFTCLGISRSCGRLLRPCVISSESALFRRCLIGTSTADQSKFGGEISLTKRTNTSHQYDHIPSLFGNVQAARTLVISGLLFQSKVMPNEKPELQPSLKPETANSLKQDTADAPANEVQQPPPPPLSRKAQLKQAIKDYGATVIIFHVTMSLGSLGFFYMLVSSGLDVLALLESFGVSKSVLESKVTQGASTFVVAYAVHKVFAPVRITITLTAVPFLVKYLRRIGFLKAVKQ